jgi:hypothetical protein
MKKNLNLYYTNDISLSASLLCLGFELEMIDKKDRSKSVFVFKKTDELNQAIKNYWSNKLSLNPKDFFNCLKELKTRIYSSE